jgi:short-subunit dehydrogenase
MSAAERQSLTALVTGASSGIGWELAKLFAADGARLVLVARSEARLRELAEEVRGRHGTESRVIASDLSRPGAAEEVFGAVEAAGLGVDVLVNNAAFATYGPFAGGDPREELEEIQLNVVALTQLTKLFLPGMLARRRGGILNVASTAGFQPGPQMAVYYATKAYVLSFTEALADELLGTGVTVTVLCPGPTATGFQARASMEGARLVAGSLPLADAASVARAGYAGFKRGKRIVIPGLLNRLMVQSLRISPRRMVTRVAGILNARGH